MLQKVHTKRKITVQRTKRVHVADIFFCYIYFESNYSASFTNNPCLKQDPRPLQQWSVEVLNEGVRSKIISQVFLLFDINVKERKSYGNKVA